MFNILQNIICRNVEHVTCDIMNGENNFVIKSNKHAKTRGANQELPEALIKEKDKVALVNSPYNFCP